MSFSKTQGTITNVSVEGKNVPLDPEIPSGLSLKFGRVMNPAILFDWDFDTNNPLWTSAFNANWDTAETYVTRMPDGGIDNSPHLALGNGSGTGIGMATSDNFPTTGGAVLEISWQALSATTDTLQILCVRVYDKDMIDITAATPPPTQFGWGWTSTSQAHGIWGIGNQKKNQWENLKKIYPVPENAAFVRFSLRHWIGGDHLVHVDDFHVEVTGGILWDEFQTARAPLTQTFEGFLQSALWEDYSVISETLYSSSTLGLNVSIRLRDTSKSPGNIPFIAAWSLPCDLEGWTWWDDLATSVPVLPDIVFSNAFNLAGHQVSYYPFCSVTGDDFGMSLATPMSKPLMQRFECSLSEGIRSVWEMALSPLTKNPGKAEMSLVFYPHDPGWGFRSAAAGYYDFFPDYFIKRTRREGAWLYPIPPNLIPNPQDFGFAFFETWPLGEEERSACASHDIGIFYYTEPWLAWQSWGYTPVKPPYQERVDLLESWAEETEKYVKWQDSGGILDSGCLRLGDGETQGAGMATSGTVCVTPGTTLSISWKAKVSSTDNYQILCIRIFDAEGTDITSGLPIPSGWFWSPASQAHVVAGIPIANPDTWENKQYNYSLPYEAHTIRISIRHWRGGDHFVYMDDLNVTAPGPTGILSMDFNTGDVNWTSSYNSEWDNGGPSWLRVPQDRAARAVISSSPRDFEDNFLIDVHSYLWHEWAPNVWNQAWPVNSDPDLPDPNMFDIYQEKWILPELEKNAGVYIDSVTISPFIGGWENYNTDHLAVSDWPLTFSSFGTPVQIGIQTQAKFLNQTADELHNMGKLMMLNLFANASRFHSRNADIMGSEVFSLVEDDKRSRLRRTLARTRIVTNLLQWGWGGADIGYNQMEEYIRGQLYWGFYPGVSSGGGPMSGGAPDRYFKKPQLYERDRSLFQKYIPIIKKLSAAGWESVTFAFPPSGGEIERFGDLSSGEMYFTVRGRNQKALKGAVAIDLTKWNITNPSKNLQARDIIKNVSVFLEPGSDSGFVNFHVDLDAGEVGVFCLSEKKPSGFQMH